MAFIKAKIRPGDNAAPSEGIGEADGEHFFELGAWSNARWNLHGQANMFATPLTSLVSAVREFTALLEVRQAKLLPHLLAAEKRITSGGASSEASLSQRAPETRSEGILDGFNESQRAAIEDAATR